MRHARLILAAVVMLPLIASSASAMELDSFMGEIDVRARADLGAFHADLAATFDVSSGDVNGLFRIFDRPADVYITLRICEIAHVSIDHVVARYRAHRGQGWGVIAKELGIKPGSAEFHALKQGRLASHSRTASSGRGNGNGKGKGKGR